MVAYWEKIDHYRLLAGALTGLIGGIITVFIALFLSAYWGLESLYPIKLFATICMGSSATELGDRTDVLLTGGLVIFGLFSILGLIFSHFVFARSIFGLFWMGIVWGIFSWIFIWNLFLQAFKPILNSGVNSSSVLLLCLIYGSSLLMLKWIEPLVRKQS